MNDVVRLNYTVQIEFSIDEALPMTPPMNNRCKYSGDVTLNILSTYVKETVDSEYPTIPPSAIMSALN